MACCLPCGKLLALAQDLNKEFAALLDPVLARPLCRHEAERAMHHVERKTIDSVGSEGVNVNIVFRTHHLSSTHKVEDLHLFGGEVRIELLVAVHTAGRLQIVDFLQDRATFGNVHGRVKGVRAKVNCLVDLFLGKLAVGISSSLDNCS